MDYIFMIGTFIFYLTETGLFSTVRLGPTDYFLLDQDFFKSVKWDRPNLKIKFMHM